MRIAAAFMFASGLSLIPGMLAGQTRVSIQASVSDPARPSSDTARDAARHPADLLAFAGIKPGMKVVDLLPGGGYFTRVFSRAVGPGGQVYAYFGLQYDARLRSRGQDPDTQFSDLRTIYVNLSTIHGPLEGFATPTMVDLVWTSDNYHDLHNRSYGPVDPVKINRAIYASLKPGGIYMVVDHRAAKGAGPDVTETLHRMDEDIAVSEIESVGFKLIAESGILTNLSDVGSKRVFEEGEHDHTDQMVLKFQKPR